MENFQSLLKLLGEKAEDKSIIEVVKKVEEILPHVEKDINSNLLKYNYDILLNYIRNGIYSSHHSDIIDYLVSELETNQRLDNSYFASYFAVTLVRINCIY